MNCKRCGGKIFVDSAFSQLNHVELFCIGCGKRWMVSKEGNAFGQWLEQRVKSTI